MKKLKVLVVFGTRPEAIKMAPLCHSLAENEEFFDTTICVTAQHREMLDQVLTIFGITPDIDLNLMKQGQDLFDVTSSVMLGLREVLSRVKYDFIFVHGDTTTAMATAISGFYAAIPVAHVEAGLRTNDIYSPFPEEFNRQTVGKVSSVHFAPTQSSKQNLLSDGISDSDICVTGNTVIDALFWMLQEIEASSGKREKITKFLSDRVSIDFESQNYILITGHRRENFGEGFLNICNALEALALDYPDVHFIYPVHLNPNVQKPVNEKLGGFKNIHLIEPLGYEPFVYLLKNCYLVLTDSGGIQEEAPSLGKPVLVMRDVTERPEAVDAGTVRLVGANAKNIVDGIAELIDDKNSYEKMAQSHNPYGDGKACARIVDYMKGKYCEQHE